MTIKLVSYMFCVELAYLKCYFIYQQILVMSSFIMFL